MAKTTHIAVISIPSFSHQASIIEFCKRLLHLHENLHITCIFPTYGTPIPATLALFESLPPIIEHILLPPVKNEDLPHDVDGDVHFKLAVEKSMPSLRSVLGSLLSTTPPPVALIADPFVNEALEIAKEFSLKSYIYSPLSAMALSLLLHIPTLHEEVSGEFRDAEAIRIPGSIPIHGRDLPGDFYDRSGLAYELILQRGKRFSLADGFLVNSFFEMEKDTAKALEEHDKKGNKDDAPVYLVGPIIQTGSKSESKGSESVGWLENQRPNSVLYVSFGSGGTLSQEQLDELALGLELSGQKFLWVLRAPSGAANADDDPFKFLPHGFLERTKGQGLVVPSWAPQTQILSHTSTGGFFTHCGWNSALESIVLGVPMITLPLSAEQRLNAAFLAEGLRVAIRPKYNESGVVEREEIAKGIKDLIVGEEGNEIRQKLEKLKDAAADALKEDGSSTRAISQFGTRIID